MNSLRKFLLCAVITLLIGACVTVNPAAAEEQSAMPEFTHYFIKLKPVRPAMVYDMTEAEQKVMGEHFQYLKKLTQKGTVVLAGPVFADPGFGLMVVKASSDEEAKAIAQNDPSVLQGVNTFEIAPMVNSLMAHNVPRFRYATESTDRAIRKEVTVAGTREEAWKLWTTTEGLRLWFTPYSSIELKIGGKFEILFSMDAPEGSRGSEGCRVLSYLPNEMLSFEWNAPPSLPDMRDLHHFVVVQFEQASADSVKVKLTDLGFGEGDGWTAVYDYFDAAWGRVMANFEKYVSEGAAELGKK